MVRGGRNFNPHQNINTLEISVHLRSLANSAIMSSLTVHCKWEENDTAREMTAH